MHIPFCEKRCGYCAFNTFADKNELIDRYVVALLSQLEQELMKRETPFYSIYFGGGTPSMLKIRHFEKIFDRLHPFIDKDTEITIEANPSSWDKEKAKALFEMGANRLSLGMQSLDDKKLSFLSRVHDSKSALKAYEYSISAGFSNISVDFMYDTPFDDGDFITTELDKFLALDAAHISAYSLTIEEGTPFEKRGVATRYDANAAQSIAARLKDVGYEHYEVASFGRIRSKHNFGYWEYRPYIGIGAGAVGFNGQVRIYSHTAIESYIENPFFAETEKLSVDDIRIEKILLGLRSSVGFDKILVKDKKETVQMLIKNSIIKESETKLFCSNFFLADEIAAKLV